jgi:hypothetical protein
MRAWLASIALVAAGCRQLLGISDPAEQADAATQDAQKYLTFAGTTVDTSGAKVDGTLVEWAIDPTPTPIANTTSNSAASYTLVVPYNGVSLAGLVHAAHTGYLDTYLYPAAPLTAGGTLDVLLISQTVLDGLCAAEQVTCDSTKAFLIIAAVDSANTLLAGVTISTAPAGIVKYDGGNGVPTPTATTTASDGRAYVFQVPPGTTTVAATMTGRTFAQHSFIARHGAFTGTSIVGTAP